MIVSRKKSKEEFSCMDVQLNEIVNKHSDGNDDIVIPLVVNVRQPNLLDNGFTDFKHWNSQPQHVYIGRGNRHVLNSKWANPYRIEGDNRNECIARYEQMVRNDQKLMDSIAELNGRVLGCWCRPEP